MLDFDLDCNEAVPTHIVPEKVSYPHGKPDHCDDLHIRFGLGYTADGHRADWTGFISISCGEYSVEIHCESQSSVIEPNNLPAELSVYLRDMFSSIADIGNVSVEQYLTGSVLEWLHDTHHIATKVTYLGEDEPLRVEMTFNQHGAEKFGFDVEVPMEQLVPDEEGLRKADATSAFLAQYDL